MFPLKGFYSYQVVFVTLYVHNLCVCVRAGNYTEARFLMVCVFVSVCVRGRETPCWPQMASLSFLTSPDQFLVKVTAEDKKSAQSPQNDRSHTILLKQSTAEKRWVRVLLVLLANLNPFRKPF